MKTIDITAFLLAASLLLFSCSSEGDDVPEVIVPQDATLTLAIAPGSVLTKAATSETTPPVTKDGEKKINNICAALFKEDGNLLTTAYVDYTDITGKTPDTIRISAKSDTKYTYVVLVNVGNVKCSSMDDLLKLSYDLENIKEDNQPMCSNFITITSLKPGENYYGSKEVFNNKPDGVFYSKSNISVYRTASRIDLEEISINWSEADAADLQAEGARFLLKHVYVVDAKSATYLADHTKEQNNNSVEMSNQAYLHGKPSGGEGFLPSLDLYTLSDANKVIITPNEKWDITKNPLRCYVTENTDASKPTMLVVKGDILHKDNDNPILKDRFFFIRLKDMVDTQKNTLPGVIRNYVIRIKATITGKGSGDEIYRENAYATVTVTPDEWSVETQHENVN